MKRFYDADHQRLIYIGHAATEEFWDSHWKTDDFRRAVTATPNSWVAKTTRRFLSKGSRVLEGGCGPANHVYALQNQGFEAVGVDFAPKTVSLLKDAAPELDIRLGDVRSLPFENQSFDGYWSLGVIEHFWGGYQQIAEEMHRVLRKEGFLFLTFPAMTDIRVWKAKRGKYSIWQDGAREPDGFYQFALSSEETIENFSELGFDLVHQEHEGSFKGLKDEITWLQPVFQPLQRSSSLLARVMKRGINETVPPKWFGHMSVLVLQKN